MGQSFFALLWAIDIEYHHWACKMKGTSKRMCRDVPCMLYNCFPALIYLTICSTSCMLFFLHLLPSFMISYVKLCQLIVYTMCDNYISTTLRWKHAWLRCHEVYKLLYLLVNDTFIWSAFWPIYYSLKIIEIWLINHLYLKILLRKG